MNSYDTVIMKMIEFDAGDPLRIQHFLKVYEFAHLIAVGENLDDVTRQTLEIAAILHDIGILPSEKKYGNCNGKHQEEMGPPCAEQMLREIGGFSDEMIERVCFLIGHHHTYNGVEGMDWQILLEADFLVNAFEDQMHIGHMDAIRHFEEKVFRTDTGKRLLHLQFYRSQEIS